MLLWSCELESVLVTSPVKCTMRWRCAYVEPWGRGQVGPGSWAAGGKHPVVGGVVSDHRQQEHERHRAEDHHAPTHQRRQLRRCNRQIAIFRFEIVTVPACLTGWLSVYATDYQKPKSLSVLTTIFPPPLPFGRICFVVLVMRKGGESSWSGPWHLGCTSEVSFSMCTAIRTSSYSTVGPNVFYI